MSEGLGGLPAAPLNTPGGAPLIPGVQPGLQQAAVVANVVIIFGPTGAVVGLFVYKPGTIPGPGNPPLVSVTAGTKDPYGNTVIAGVSTYSPGSGTAAAFNSGQIAFFTGPMGGGGPFVLASTFGYAVGAAMSLFGPQTGLQEFALGNTGGETTYIFPSGDTTGADDFTNISDVVSTIGIPNQVKLAPGQFYINDTIDMHAVGPATFDGSGSGLTVLNIVGNNIPGVWAAGNYQRVRHMSIRYETQQNSTDTNAIGLMLGDDTHGSCFLSEFEDLFIEQSAYGMAINPAVTTVAGFFACNFKDIHIFGGGNDSGNNPSGGISAINFNGGNGTGAGITTCHFDNVFVHDNFQGSLQPWSGPAVELRNITDSVFNSLDIEHGILTSQGGALTLAQCAGLTFNSTHFEELELAGTPGLGIVGIGTQVGDINFNNVSVRFSTFTGTSHNSVFTVTGGSGQFVRVNGLDMPTSDGGDLTPVLALVDFNNATDVSFIIEGIDPSGPLATVNYINAGAGCSLTIAPVFWNYVGTAGNPGFAAGWSNFGAGNANLAFGMVAPQMAWINGVILGSGAAGTLIFTLPAGFKPASDQFIFVVDVTAGAVLSAGVNPSGQIILSAAPAAHEYALNGQYALAI